MTEERITETRDPEGNTHTSTTIVRDSGETTRGGGGAKWLLLIVLLVAVVGAIYVFSQGTGAEIAKDNAIGDAAGQVGDAAQQVGTAVEDVANDVTNGE